MKSDPVRQVLDYYKKLASFMPPEIPAWNDSDNNKMLIQGKASLIMNPPSAWAVAKRDAPQVAEQCWTHGFPAGPKGRFAPFLPFFLGTWAFGKNKSAVKSLLVHLSQPANVERLVAASEGYDIPSFANLATKSLRRGGTAERHALSLPESAQPSGPVDRRQRGTAQDRPSDLRAGDHDQDDRALHKGEPDGEDALVGRG